MTALAPAATQRLLTYEEYLDEFLSKPPTRQPYYILDGVKIMPPSPRLLHQVVIDNLLDLFREIRRSSGGAIRSVPSPLDLLIRGAPLRTRQPDVVVMSGALYERIVAADLAGPLTEAPELVVEVLSPSETRTMVEEKIADFLSIGVRECWVISTEAETVEVLALNPEAITTVAIYGRTAIVQSLAFESVKVAVKEILAY